MSVPSCPPGLRAAIFERDGFRCAACPGVFPEWALQMQHLINRAGCDAHLRWSPKNLLTLCASCHGKVTDEKPEFQKWSCSKFGDQDANLDAFWKALGRDWKLESENGLASAVEEG